MKFKVCFRQAACSWEFILPGVFFLCLISVSFAHLYQKYNVIFVKLYTRLSTGLTFQNKTAHVFSRLFLRLAGSHFATTNTYACFLNPDLIHFLAVATAPVRSSVAVLLTLASLPHFGLPLDSKEQRRCLVLLLWEISVSRSQMIRAKVLYLVSVLLKLCKKQHFKDKCPSVQREWEEFIKNKENWKGTLGNPGLNMLLYKQSSSKAFSALWLWSKGFLRHKDKQFLFISMKY